LTILFDMNTEQLFKNFHNAINWNAFLYVIQKGLFCFSSFLLYKNLSVATFSLWANINCFIFLFLLWIDFGFRKSVPRYAPEFAQIKNGTKKFVRGLIFFQLTVLAIATPLFFLLAHFFLKQVHISCPPSLLFFACGLFFVEGMVALVRLVFHSYFWNKQFNLLSSVVLLFQMICVVALIYTTDIDKKTVHILFFIKIVAGVFILGASVYMLRFLYKDKTYCNKKKPALSLTKGVNKLPTKKFIQHSGVMWATSFTKSLTERNFLVPLFTVWFGPGPASLFKLANDAALFFQRVAIKTIGTTDTSLFAHLEARGEGKKSLAVAFSKLATKLTALCIPLLGISLFVFCSGYRLPGNTPLTSTLFLTLVICYLLHVLLSAYERILEVKRKYRMLFIIYLPYIALLGSCFFLFHYGLVSSIGLLGCIGIIHGVRLVSVSIAAQIARAQFGVRFRRRST